MTICFLFLSFRQHGPVKDNRRALDVVNIMRDDLSLSLSPETPNLANWQLTTHDTITSTNEDEDSDDDDYGDDWKW